MAKLLKPIIKQRNLNVRNLLKSAKATTTTVKEEVKGKIYLGKDPLTGKKLFR